MLNRAYSEAWQKCECLKYFQTTRDSVEYQHQVDGLKVQQNEFVTVNRNELLCRGRKK